MQSSLKAQTLGLGIEMAKARKLEGQDLTHLIFRWCDESKYEVLGFFSSLPLHPSPRITLNDFISTSID